mgnify:CR=1 FL=1
MSQIGLIVDTTLRLDITKASTHNADAIYLNVDIGDNATCSDNTISHNVSPVEIDFNGHTNNQNYVRLVVSLVPSHFIESHNLVDFHIKYAQETFLGDKLIATLQEYGETCLSCDIRKATDQSLVCEISSHWEHR